MGASQVASTASYLIQQGARRTACGVRLMTVSAVDAIGFMFRRCRVHVYDKTGTYFSISSSFLTIILRKTSLRTLSLGSFKNICFRHPHSIESCRCSRQLGVRNSPLSHSLWPLPGDLIPFALLCGYSDGVV